MPFTHLLIHAVWAVKERKQLMYKDQRNILCQHIRENGKEKNIHILNVNGWLDHLHCFISLSPDQNISTIMNLIKGESSYWANRNLKWDEKFGWQDDYFAVTVSRSHEEAVCRYIDKQEEHHRVKSFAEEYNEFIEKYEFKT